MSGSSRVSWLLCLFGAVLCAQVTLGLRAPPLVTLDETVLVPENEDVSLRLPNDTIPIRYDIFLKTRIDEGIFNFDGVVNIQIQCKEATSTIVLHNRISVISKVVLKSGATETEITGFTTDTETEFLTIPLAAPLVKDQEYTLVIEFVGEHTVDNVGWYRASYTNDNGEEIWFATTDFEAPDARQAFPCYDEPDKKAIFRFEITHNSKYHAISNMPIAQKITNDDGTVTTSFDDTPRMSTYLLAFVVSDYDKNCATDSKNREQCVYARPNGMNLTPWSLKVAVQGLIELENILNVPYSLPKMDQIAIPDKDFASGAMENWGLVTYRESRLLIDESKYNYKEKDYIGTVILHEFAHQWFGDLVSPKWWTYLWLNEAFATLFEYYATHKVLPDMRLPDLMVLECLHNIMVSDASDDPRPLTHYVESKTNIRSLFNYVSYQKGGAVLRMMMLALGEQTFYKGLQYYQEEMAYQNAVAEDLFRGLQKSVDEAKVLPDGLNMETIMNSWSLQGGYPLITATRDSETKVTLTQKRFKLSDANAPASSYYIPITFTQSEGVSFASATTQDWFRGNTASHSLTIDEKSSWYILNKQQSSLYRVNYDENNWRQLANALNNEDSLKNIHLLNRAQLLDDSLDLALNNRLNSTIPFDILRYLEAETDYIPWAAAENGLNQYYAKLKMSDNAEFFHEFLKNLTTKLYGTYGAKASANDVYFTHLARNFAIRWACRVGLAACQKDVSEIYSANLKSGTELDLNYSDVIPCAGSRTISTDNYNLLITRFGSAVSTSERTSIIDSLMCSYNAEHLNKLLALTIESTSPFTATEKFSIYNTLSRRDIQGLELVLEFFKANSAALKAQVTVANTVTLFRNIATATYSKKFSETVKEVAKLFENSLGSENLSVVDASLATNLKWMEEEGEIIVNSLDDKGAASTIFVSFFLIFAAVIVSLFRNY